MVPNVVICCRMDGSRFPLNLVETTSLDITVQNRIKIVSRHPGGDPGMKLRRSS